MEKEKDGVWRTIRGRRIFIASGESLGQAMAKSGKFKREDIRMAKEGVSQADRFDKVNRKALKSKLNEKQRQKEIHKMQNKSVKYSNSVYSPTKNQDMKNQRFENAPTKEEGKTRVERNMLKYSDTDKRELTHEALQKKLADYKAKKQSNIRNYRQEQKDLLEDMSKLSEEQLKEYRDLFKEQGKNKFAERIDKHLEKRKQSNNKADPYDDPESNESQRLQSIQSRYDEYLQDTEGRGASYGEIAYVDSLRGKDLDDFEKELDDYETKKYGKQEKATKKIKKDSNDWLPKATEIKEQGKSNRKEVSDNIQAHILSYYDNPEDFIHQMDVMKQPTNWHNGMQLAKGGSYLVYYDDQRKFLDDLKINPKGKDFSDDRVFETYSQLIGRESEKLYNKIKKHQAETISNYKKRKGK